MPARNHRSLVVYLVLVAGVTVAILGYQRHTNSRLNKADRISCENRRVLTANQQVVLEVLRQHIDANPAAHRTIDQALRRMKSIPNC